MLSESKFPLIQVGRIPCETVLKSKGAQEEPSGLWGGLSPSMSTGHPHSQESRQAKQKISLAKQGAPVRAPVQKLHPTVCGGRGSLQWGNLGALSRQVRVVSGKPRLKEA